MLSARVPADLAHAVEVTADATGISKTLLIERALRAAIYPPGLMERTVAPEPEPPTMEAIEAEPDLRAEELRLIERKAAAKAEMERADQIETRALELHRTEGWPLLRSRAVARKEFDG